MENQEELLKTIQSLKTELAGLKEEIKKKPKKKYKPRAKKEEEKIVETPRRGGVRFKGNTWSDDGKLCAEDKSFDKKVSKKSKRVPRVREAPVQIEIACSRCLQKSLMFPLPGNTSRYFVCSKCAKS